LIFPFFIFLHLDHLIKDLIEIFLILSFFLIIDNFLQSIEVIIFEDIHFEFFEILVAEGASMVSIYRLFDAVATVDMTAAGYVAVCDGV
jgi:hypothetical protein